MGHILTSYGFDIGHYHHIKPLTERSHFHRAGTAKSELAAGIV